MGYIQFFGQKQKGCDDPPIELLCGAPAITETLMGDKLRFEISPQSFFQVNIEGAEKLYSKCTFQEKPVLFDVCCGTGTIGLCLADKCGKVIGVDIVEEAVENARKNAAANSVTNAEYHAGRAEQVLPELLKRRRFASADDVSDDVTSPVVAVVDPPRAGLHHKAVQAGIKSLVKFKSSLVSHSNQLGSIFQ